MAPDSQPADLFTDLLRKAEAGVLNEEERAAWIRITDETDIAGWSVDQAAPHYLEGKLRASCPACEVEWHDGEIQRIPDDIASVLRCVRIEQEFGAYVKLGKNNQVLSLERVVIL